MIEKPLRPVDIAMLERVFTGQVFIRDSLRSPGGLNHISISVVHHPDGAIEGGEGNAGDSRSACLAGHRGPASIDRRGSAVAPGAPRARPRTDVVDELRRFSNGAEQTCEPHG